MKIKVNPFIIVLFFSSILNMTYLLNAINNSDEQKRKQKDIKITFLVGRYWDMPEDSVLAIYKEKYDNNGLDYVFIDDRGFQFWITKEYRFKNDKLYEYIYQWNNKNENQAFFIFDYFFKIDKTTKISDSSFVFNEKEDTKKQLFKRILNPPYRIELERNLMYYDIKYIIEKKIGKDSYNCYEIYTKPQHRITMDNIRMLDHHLIFGNTKDSVISYQKSIGNLEPIYESYDKITYPYKKLNKKKGTIEFRFYHNKLVKIVEQWSGFSDNEIKNMNLLHLNPGFGKQMTQFEITNQDLNKVIDENHVSFSSNLDIGKYRIVVRKVLLEPLFFNFVQNMTYSTYNQKIISYNIYKEYTLYEE